MQKTVHIYGGEAKITYENLNSSDITLSVTKREPLLSLKLIKDSAKSILCEDCASVTRGGIIMERILFINACVRESSRTLELARCILDKLSGEICEINLEQENLKPLDGNVLEIRERLVSENNFSDTMFHYAKEFAAADTIVIAAPYWDFAFPALLKIYLEQITVCGVTFRYKKGVPQGMCRAKRLIYVTTAGGTIYDNFGFEYLKALAQKLYGIDEVLFFKAENLDIDGYDVNDILRMAKSDAEKTLKEKTGF